jgi:hypothetical protein
MKLKEQILKILVKEPNLTGGQIANRFGYTYKEDRADYDRIRIYASQLIKRSSSEKPNNPQKVVQNYIKEKRKEEVDNQNEFLSLAENVTGKQRNTYNLPNSLETHYEAYKLPKECNDILFINDIHLPYHSLTALNIALKYGFDKKVNTIFINGDLIDFYAISRFQKDPRKRDLGTEIKTTRDFLAVLRKIFPLAKIFYKLGNHDVRWEHYLIEKAPDLLGLSEFNLESILKLADHDITMIPDKQIVHIGKLTALHGHELGTSIMSPVNIARGLYLKAKDNAICGHHHQSSEHTEPNINGKVVTCWSVACLSELHPDYAPINKYTHGFAHVRVVDEEGNFEVTNLRIINGKIR